MSVPIRRERRLYDESGKPIGSGTAALDHVVIGDRAVPRIIEASFPGDGRSARLEMTIDSSSGVPRCSRIQISQVDGGREVTEKDLDLIRGRLKPWIVALTGRFSDRVERDADGRIVRIVVTSDEEEFQAAQVAIGKVRYRRKRTPEFTAEIAAKWHEFKGQGNVAELVANAYGVDPRQANRWFEWCRDEKLIPPPKSGKKGK